MSSSVKLILREPKKTKSGEIPIYLRITADTRSNFIATGAKVAKEYWNETKQEVRSSHRIADALNSRIKGLKTRAEKELLKGKSSQEVKQALQGAAGDFVLFFETYIQRLVKTEQFWEERKFRTTLNKCQECWGKNISWKHIDSLALEKFELFLRRDKKNGINTTRKELSRIRRLSKLALRQGVISTDPFQKYDLPRGERTERRKLSLEEIEALRNVELDSFSAIARDVFLFSFYSAGVRFGDLCSLKVADVKDGRVKYKAAKTGKPISVPIPPQAQEIAKRYAQKKTSEEFLFPFIRPRDSVSVRALKARVSSRNAQVNTYLKRIAEKAGIDSQGLSMHVARHSYADYARMVSGDIHAIMQALGHSDVRVTQTYLKSLDTDAVDKLSSQLWN